MIHSQIILRVVGIKKEGGSCEAKRNKTFPDWRIKVLDEGVVDVALCVWFFLPCVW